MSGSSRSRAAQQAARASGTVVAHPKQGDAHLDHLLAGAIEVFPAVALFDDGLQVLLPDDAILHRVFDDRAGQARRHIVGAQLTPSP